MSIRKEFGNYSISAGGSDTASPAVYVIQPNNSLVPTSFQGIRYKATAPTSSVDLSNPKSLVATILPDGIGVGLDVTSGSAVLICNTSPSPTFDLLAGSNVQLNSSTVGISGSGTYAGQSWNAYTILNIF